MNKKYVAAMILSLAIPFGMMGTVSAESIPVQRRAVVNHATKSGSAPVKVTVKAAPKASAPKKSSDGDEKKKTSKSTSKTKASSKNKNSSGNTLKISALGPEVEVGLLSNTRINITALVPLQAVSNGKVIGKYNNGASISITRSGNTILVNGKKAGEKVYLSGGKGAPAFAVKGNQYRGAMKLVPSPWNSNVTLVNVVPMETYLQGVVPSEIVPSWHADAIRAQAVAARTYAYFHKNSYRSSGYDVTDDTRSQVYRGSSVETTATNNAIKDTAGEIITYGGKAIDAVFHSSGGGYTENSENVWGTQVPYLRGVKEFYTGNPWTKTVSLSTFIKSMANMGYNVGAVKNIKLSHLRIGQAHKANDRGISGRVKSITLIGKKGTRTVPGEKIEILYGLDSALYDFSIKGKNLVITGYGYGHGLGLSQWGAEEMAEKYARGKDYYKTILTHYFTGTKIEKLY